MLSDLINVWPELLESVMRRPARVYTDMPGGGGGDKDASSFWNPAATMVIADVTDWYGLVGRTIAKERPTPADLVAPVAPFIGPLTLAKSTAREQMQSRTVFTWAIDGSEDVRLGLAAVVRWHHRWLSHYPGMGVSLLEDALRFEWAISRAMQTMPVQRYMMPGALCQVVMEETELGVRLCEGQMVGIKRRPDDDDPSELLCSNHPEHAIPRRDWILYDPTE
ncbi:hypothetical protein E3O55_08400 [Cryobacterium sp. MDB1-18-2]|uniref:hypothetical protein n=1 Tax=unclassified Cryobacterium TaxID=2649013 RepID=UPI00106CDA93|nr:MULTISPECIES: hypothetical protein [unclassified Cryobacterium]TFC30096.1 hypothetical protein E3O55_08400 [Cryobacterium sp. MDB1-18-2]TFC41376.1 hypothetical protein E3O50_09840 [Cryobacterium sp. MDB1-18-1]